MPGQRNEPLLHVQEPASASPETSRVVGKNALAPGCSNIIFAFAFLANVIAVCFLFFTWIGGGCQGWPDGDVVENVLSRHNETMRIAQASLQTGSLSLLLSLVWVFVFLFVMKVAALLLIVVTFVAAVSMSAGLGYLALNEAMACTDRTPTPCGESERVLACVGGIGLLTCAALMLLWLCCVRDRIVFTARLFSAVAGVLATCPGTILVAFVSAATTVAWHLAWGGALIQLTIYTARGKHERVLYGQWAGMCFGFLLSLFWGHKVFVNISHMTSCHVIASWYFDPDTATEGIPCCKPVTLIGLKRSMTNYLGSIAFGSLIVAILEAIYYTVKLVFEKAQGSNFLIKLVACCVLCILNCIKSCIEWLTEWAYCYISLYGCSFIEAGGKVFKMLGESGMGAVAQSTLVEPVLWMGRLCGMAIGVGAGFLTLESVTIKDGYSWSQPFVGAIIGYVVTSVALSCVDAGNKCIYVCFVDAPEHMDRFDPDIKASLEGHSKSKMAEYNKGGTSTANVDVNIRP